jgi:lambda family phage minor tail protein L
MTSISDAPSSHVVDANQLQADGIVELWEINLADGSVIRVKNNNLVTWRGNDYEAFAIQITGEAQSNDSEVARPTLSIVNPEGAFSPAIHSGQLNKATVVRKRVLYNDLVNNRNVFQQHSWTLSRVLSLNKNLATFQLRSVGDMQFFVIPPRMFTPPDFPQVSLS